MSLTYVMEAARQTLQFHLLITDMTLSLLLRFLITQSENVRLLHFAR